MNPVSPKSYRRDTDMAADDMISEGGPLRQPTQAESEAALAHAKLYPAYYAKRGDESPWRGGPHPLTLFLAGVGTGLVISLLLRGRRQQVPVCEAV